MHAHVTTSRTNRNMRKLARNLVKLHRLFASWKLICFHIETRMMKVSNSFSFRKCLCLQNIDFDVFWNKASFTLWYCQCNSPCKSSQELLCTLPAKLPSNLIVNLTLKFGKNFVLIFQKISVFIFDFWNLIWSDYVTKELLIKIINAFE